MSSTQNLQRMIDSIKVARLQQQQEQEAAHYGQPQQQQQHPYRIEPRDVLELEFMDSLDQRMAQMERSLDATASTHHPSASVARNNQHQHQSIVSPAPTSMMSPASTPSAAASGSSGVWSRFNKNNSLSASTSARRTFMSSSTLSRSVLPPSTSLVFRVTLPFLRSNVVDKSTNNSECATFVVHVADLSQTGDDLLWHIVAQARIRFPDLMSVGGFEWTPGAASTLVLFALSADEVSQWVSQDQARAGSNRAGGAFLHYDGATPIHRFQPVAAAIRKREAKLASNSLNQQHHMTASELMSRTIRDMNPSPVDVEVFVLMKNLVPAHELKMESLKRGLIT